MHKLYLLELDYFKDSGFNTSRYCFKLINGGFVFFDTARRSITNKKIIKIEEEQLVTREVMCKLIESISPEDRKDRVYEWLEEAEQFNEDGESNVKN